MKTSMVLLLFWAYSHLSIVVGRRIGFGGAIGVAFLGALCFLYVDSVFEPDSSHFYEVQVIVFTMACIVWSTFLTFLTHTRQRHFHSGKSEGFSGNYRQLVAWILTTISVICVLAGTALELAGFDLHGSIRPSSTLHLGTFGSFQNVALSQSGDILIASQSHVFLVDGNQVVMEHSEPKRQHIKLIDISPNGAKSCYISNRCCIRIVDSKSSSESRILDDPSLTIVFVRFINDDLIVFAGSTNNSDLIHVINVNTSRILARRVFEKWQLGAMTLSENRGVLAVGLKKTTEVALLDPSTLETTSLVRGTEVQEIIEGGVLAVSREGSRMAGSHQNSILLYRKNGMGNWVMDAQIASGGVVTMLNFLGDEALVIASLESASLKVYSIQGGKHYLLRRLRWPVKSISVATDRRQVVAVDYGGNFALWNIGDSLITSN